MHNQYVTFRLAQCVYAIDVRNAREVIEVEQLTPLPSSPPWLLGVVNLRGSVVPVVDLKAKFDLGASRHEGRRYILLVDVTLDDGVFMVGVMIDSPLSVLEYDDAAIEPPPKFGGRYSRKYLRGLGRIDGQLFEILDADTVLADSNTLLFDGDDTHAAMEHAK
jgi:purine-binding chemotaxis protein CheW